MRRRIKRYKKSGIPSALNGEDAVFVVLTPRGTAPIVVVGIDRPDMIRGRPVCDLCIIDTKILQCRHIADGFDRGDRVAVHEQIFEGGQTRETGQIRLFSMRSSSICGFPDSGATSTI